MDEFELEIQAARFGARMAQRGYTPSEIETLMRTIWPALDAARRAVAADPNTIWWESSFASEEISRRKISRRSSPGDSCWHGPGLT